MIFEQSTRRRPAPARYGRLGRAAATAATLAGILLAVAPPAGAVAPGAGAGPSERHAAQAEPTEKPEQPEKPPVDVPAVDPTESADPESEVSGSGPLVVLGIGGLTWEDIDPKTTPALWRLAERSALGNLTVRTVRSNTCAIDGWLTLSAGRRAGTELVEGQPQRCPAIPEPDSAGTPGGTSPAQPAPATLPEFAAYRSFNAAQDYDADPGTLADVLSRDSSSCSLAIGPGAAAALAGRDGRVAEYLPRGAVPASLGACALTAVDLGSLGDSTWLPPEDTTVAAAGTGDPANLLDPAAPLPGEDPADRAKDPDAPQQLSPEELDRARSALRARQLKAADSLLQRYLDAVPSGTAVMLLGLSDSQNAPRLGAVMVSQSGGNQGLLTSQSTRREGLIQLTDVAPTILNMLGRPRTADFVGTPAAYAQKVSSGAGEPGTEESGSAEEPNRTTAADVATLRTQARASELIHRNAGGFSILLDTAHYVFYVLLGLALFAAWRRRALDRRASSPRRARQLAWTGLVLGAVPTATFLAALSPWATSPAPMLALAGSIAAATVVLVAITLAGPWRRSWLGRTGALGLTTAILLGVDVATGSRLQLNSFLGYNPIVGGRFYGLGNMAVALFIVGALMGSAALVTPWIRAGHRRRAALLVALIGIAGVGVLGNPAWGAKFGGTIAALAGFIVLVLMLLRIRLNIRRLILVGAIALVTLLGIAGLDYLRPADQRSHFGLFFGQLLDGEFVGIILRKLAANLSIISINPLLSIIVPCGLLAIGLFLGWLKRWDRTRRYAHPWAGRLVAVIEAVPTLWPGFAATLLALLVGLVITDSGIAVPATGFMLLIPILVALCADRRPEPPGPESPSGPAERAADQGRAPSSTGRGL